MRIDLNQDFLPDPVNGVGKRKYVVFCWERVMSTLAPAPVSRYSYSSAYAELAASGLSSVTTLTH